jgi:hypothetical protein
MQSKGHGSLHNQIFSAVISCSHAGREADGQTVILELTGAF